MATGVQSTSKAVGEQMAAMIVNLGGSPPTSEGLGELWYDLATAIQAFSPPSGSDIALAPSTATGATLPRALAAESVTIATVSGTIYMNALYLPINTVVNAFNVVTGSTASSNDVTINWAALCNGSRVILAASANATTQLTPAGYVNNLPVATVAAGAATSFTTTYSGLYYIAYTVGATTTQPTVCGYTSAGTEANKIAPILCGTSSTSATATVPAVPTTLGAITATVSMMYVYTT